MCVYFYTITSHVVFHLVCISLLFWLMVAVRSASCRTAATANWRNPCHVCPARVLILKQKVDATFVVIFRCVRRDILVILFSAECSTAEYSTRFPSNANTRYIRGQTSSYRSSGKNIDLDMEHAKIAQKERMLCLSRKFTRSLIDDLLSRTRIHLHKIWCK